MPLPNISVPRYTMTLSTGAKISYRPFLVREQKTLLQAIEMGDMDQTNNALEDILAACTFGDVDIKSLPIADVEMLMLNIRAKSSGEVIELAYRCNHEVTGEDGQPKACGKKVSVELNLSEVKVNTTPGRERKIMLTDDVGIVMRDMPYGVYADIRDKKTAEAAMTGVAACIESVFDLDTVYTRKDYTEEELLMFIEQIPQQAFKKVEAFIDTMPQIEHEIEVVCPACGAKDTVKLRGLSDFLV